MFIYDELEMVKAALLRLFWCEVTVLSSLACLLHVWLKCFIGRRVPLKAALPKVSANGDGESSLIEVVSSLTWLCWGVACLGIGGWWGACFIQSDMTFFMRFSRWFEPISAMKPPPLQRVSWLFSCHSHRCDRPMLKHWKIALHRVVIQDKG